ncbi:MAG: cation transporter [Erysipelotrichaceae bacterium]|nr:cation transporter [Erysipelotrichaceae bacterium]
MKILETYKKFDERNKLIIKFNLAGIVYNTTISIFKIVVGTIVHSLSIVTDGLNGLGDMMSSIVSIITTFASERKADSSHPMGYGRVEYVGVLMITFMIISLGSLSIYRSVKSLIRLEGSPNYTTAAVVIVVISMFCELTYGYLCHKAGSKHNSMSLKMIGHDCIMDGLVSLGILVTIVLYKYTGLNIEAWIGLFISIMIVKSGIETFMETTDKIIGTTVSDELRKDIKQMIISEDNVENVFNLVVHSYGENRKFGSVDIEVRNDLSTLETAKLTRRIVRRARKEKGIILTSVGIVTSSLNDPKTAEMWDRILETVRKNDRVSRVHGCLIDQKQKYISFYIVTKEGTSSKEVIEELKSELHKLYPDMEIEIDRITAL